MSSGSASAAPAPLVALETQTGEPGLASQVRRRNALLDAPQEQPQDLFLLRQRHPRLPVGRRQVVRQMQGMQGELGGFVERVVVAVAERQPGRIEAAGAVADQSMTSHSSVMAPFDKLRMSGRIGKYSGGAGIMAAPQVPA